MHALSTFDIGDDIRSRLGLMHRRSCWTSRKRASFPSSQSQRANRSRSTPLRGSQPELSPRPHTSLSLNAFTNTHNMATQISKKRKVRVCVWSVLPLLLWVLWMCDVSCMSCRVAYRRLNGWMDGWTRVRTFHRLAHSLSLDHLSTTPHQ